MRHLLRKKYGIRAIDLAEVKPILGLPGDLSTGPLAGTGARIDLRDARAWNVHVTERSAVVPLKSPDLEWIGSEGTIHVLFKIVGSDQAAFFPTQKIEQSPRDNLL
jgi:hypothetical protein